MSSVSTDPGEIIELSELLMNNHPSLFTTEFEENRLQVEKLTDIQAYRTQNRIASYITRQKKKKNTIENAHD